MEIDAAAQRERPRRRQGAYAKLSVLSERIAAAMRLSSCSTFHVGIHASSFWVENVGIEWHCCGPPRRTASNQKNLWSTHMGFVAAIQTTQTRLVGPEQVKILSRGLHSCTAVDDNGKDFVPVARRKFQAYRSEFVPRLFGLAAAVNTQCNFSSPKQHSRR